MRRFLYGPSVAAVLAFTATPTNYATAITVNCTNCATAWQQVKDSALIAKSYALEVKGWMDVANTYVKAVQNTVQLPLSALARVQGLVYRTQALGTAVSTLVGPEGSIMQRISRLNAVGRGVGGVPTGAINSWEFWDKQRERQFEENAQLLGLEQERQAINDELAQLAAENGETAEGHMQALQANNQATVAVAMQLSALNTKMHQSAEYQMERDALADAKERQELNWLVIQQTPNTPWMTGENSK